MLSNPEQWALQKKNEIELALHTNYAHKSSITQVRIKPLETVKI